MCTHQSCHPAKKYDPSTCMKEANKSTQVTLAIKYRRSCCEGKTAQFIFADQFSLFLFIGPCGTVLQDTEECARKKEEQNRLVIKNLEEENKGLNTCCADLLNDLEKLRKQEAQWKTEKSGNDARIKVRSGVDSWMLFQN